MEVLFKKILTILNTPFEIELFNASLVSLKDRSNKLRYNNFAYSLRELSRHFLYFLSPEEKIKRCIWYKPENENKITRSQRIKYAVQGGFSDEILENLGFDIKHLEKVIKRIKEEIDLLSKYTHINPEVFNTDNEKVDELSLKVLTTFANFVEIIIEYRERLKDFLDKKIEEHMIYSIVSNSFENIDSLAPHYSLEFGEISKYNISEINDKQIIVDVFGYINVILEYGSRQERHDGDGLDVEQGFPFETKVIYEIEETFPSENYEVLDFDVDTSKWYENDDIE